MEEACEGCGTLAEDRETSTWAPSHTVNLTTAWAEEGAVSQAAPVPRVRRIVCLLHMQGTKEMYRLSVHDLPYGGNFFSYLVTTLLSFFLTTHLIFYTSALKTTLTSLPSDLLSTL